MSNALYDQARAAFGNGQINWLGDLVRVCLVYTGGGVGPVYIPNLASDEYLSDIPGPAQIAHSTPLAAKTNVGGVLGADNLLIPFVSLTNPIGALVIYQDTGLPSSSRLIAFMNAAQGLPFTIPLADIFIEWALITINTVTLPRIFKL